MVNPVHGNAVARGNLSPQHDFLSVSTKAQHRSRENGDNTNDDVLHFEILPLVTAGLEDFLKVEPSEFLLLEDRRREVLHPYILLADSPDF